jgi:hypothetical protein
VGVVAARVEELSIGTSDLGRLLGALPALARLCRYGDVRGEAMVGLQGVFERILLRACVGLSGAVEGLSVDAADGLVRALEAGRAGVEVYADEGMTSAWLAAVGTAALPSAPPTSGTPGSDRVRGFCARVLVDADVWSADTLTAHARLALSRTLPPERVTAWLEGLLRGSGLAMLQQAGLWAALDEWLMALDPADLAASIVLVRRAFATFTPPERREMGRLVASRGRPVPPAPAGLDPTRVALVLPVLTTILRGTHG